MDRTHDGKPIKILTLIDEYSRHCLALEVDRSIKSDDVLYSLSSLFLIYGIPENIRSDNGPEFTAKAVRRWLKRMGVKTAFIGPRSSWENGYNESFNGKLRDELLNGEIFYNIKEAKVLIENWRKEYPSLNVGEICATIEIKINYYHPVTTGTISCITEVINRGKLVANMESSIYCKDVLIAKANGNYSIFVPRGTLG